MLDAATWLPFRYDDLFVIRRGSISSFKELPVGDTPIVTATTLNNGVAAMTDLEPTFPAGVISVANDGSPGTAFYQPLPFAANSAVSVLTPKKKLSVRACLFICAVIEVEKYRFGYGRKWGLDRMKGMTIYLPATSSGEPDWDAMDAYIKTLPVLASVVSSAEQVAQRLK